MKKQIFAMIALCALGFVGMTLTHETHSQLEKIACHASYGYDCVPGHIVELLTGDY